MARFGDRIARMDAAVMRHLSDGVSQHLSRTGQVLASAVPVIVTRGVERFNEAAGTIDRTMTVTVQRSLLLSLDRSGGFVIDGKTLHIDGIVSDDGHMITFYVKP